MKKVKGDPKRLAERFDYEDAVVLLAARGASEQMVREGSMPPESLEYCGRVIREQCAGKKPLKFLHVGNFVGVSLAYFTAVAKELDPDAAVVSVDPNIPHRGVKNPQNLVVELLSACNLQSNSMVVCGYTLNKNVGNDGRWILFTGYNPHLNYNREYSCENILPGLLKLMPASFDAAVIDGNHDGAYLRREMEVLAGLVKPGGILILDDVSKYWKDVTAVFNDFVNDGRFEKIGEDGRVGILRRSRKGE